MSVGRASSMKWQQAIAGFLGLKRNMLVLLTMVILVGLGEKMAERFLPLYLVALGGGAFSVGLLNGIWLFYPLSAGIALLALVLAYGGGLCHSWDERVR